MSIFANLGKEELRAACKTAQIKGWGKMNNTQMREALEAAQAAMGIPAVIKETEAPVTSNSTEVSAVEQLPVEDSRKPVVEEIVAPAVVTATGRAPIQKNREERHGVKRPSEGTICAAIWAALDAKRAELIAASTEETISNGTAQLVPSFKDLKALQDKNGWQRNTAVTQYQRWKEFNDLMVR